MSDPMVHPIPHPIPHGFRDRREVEKGEVEKEEGVRPSTATQEVRVRRAPAIPVSAEPGNVRLRAYLAADPKARERFDRRQAREILADCDAEWRALNEIADDPVHRRVEFERWLSRADG